MAEAVKIQAEARDAGQEQGDRLPGRPQAPQAGRIPAIIYGHKQAPVPISLARDASGR